MKKILLTAGLMLALAAPAFAGSYGNAVPFKNFSTTGTNYSNVYNVRGFTRKTFTADFTTGTGVGTVLLQCAPTASGPWQTCVQQDGTAISGTASYILSWDDAVAYVRAQFVRTSGKVNAWLNWNEN